MLNQASQFRLNLSNKNLLYRFDMNNLITLKDFLYPEGKRPDGFMMHEDLDHEMDWITSTEIQINRDSDELTESNWQVFIDGLEKTNSEDWRILRFGHFACGWYEIVILRPNSASYDYYIQCLEILEDYPILDEDHYSALQYENFNQAIEDFYCSDLRDLFHKDDFLMNFEPEISDERMIEFIHECLYSNVIESESGTDGIQIDLEESFEDIKQKFIDEFFDSENVGSIHDGSNMLAIFADWYGKDLLNVDPAIINNLQNKIDIYSNSVFLQDSIESGDTKLILNNQVHHLFIDESGIQAILFNG